jgi:glutathione synthase/RimK-type ligase-like ATP-grasp enzyme
MSRKAPDIGVHVMSPEIPVPNDFWQKTAALPTVLFGPRPIPESLDPSIRGLRLFTKRLGKFDEALLLAQAGFPVPLTQKIVPETVLDERLWGPFTVIKPNMGYRGRGVSLVRTRDARWIDTLLLPPDHPRYGQRLIAQQFVDTGPYATCYRVMTVLGRRVYSMMSTAVHPAAPLSKLPSGPVEIEIAANGGERRMTLFDDPEITALAERVHARLPHTSVMGIDIIRDHATGKLCVLEMNSGGWTWHLSSDHGRRNQREHGMDYYAQNNALEVIADALADVTRRKAV